MSERTAKAHRRIQITGITLTLKDGPETVTQELDPYKVMLVDAATGKPLYQPVIDARQERKQVTNTKE